MKREDEKMEGHGNHWSSLGDPEDLLNGIASRIAEFDNAGTRVMQTTEVRENDGSDPRERTVLGQSWPNLPLSYMLLSVHIVERNSLSFWSAYPYATQGTVYRLQIEEISEWSNGIEAHIETKFRDGPEIGLFDTHYYQNKQKYQEGEAYDFLIAGVAYYLTVTEPESFWIDQPEQIQRHKEIWNEPVDHIPDEKLEPIEIKMDQARILFPMDGWARNDFKFQGPVLGVRSFELDGQSIHVIKTAIANVDDEDLIIDIYTPDQVLDGEPPKLAEVVTGSMWLQGHLHDSENDWTT